MFAQRLGKLDERPDARRFRHADPALQHQLARPFVRVFPDLQQIPFQGVRLRQRAVQQQRFLQPLAFEATRPAEHPRHGELQPDGLGTDRERFELTRD